MNNTKSPEFQKFLGRQLRKISYMWAPRNEALRAAKVSWGKYKCAECKEIYQRKEVAIDHIEPVIATSGFENWDVYISRLFCPIENFQVLCKPCHKIKTTEENAERRALRK